MGQGRRNLNLTKTERDDWLRISHAWLPPKDFRDALDRLEAAQRDHLLTDPRAGFYRDAFCADQFAALGGADLVRLVSGERPDFQISIAGSEASYEVTEADTPGRKRGQGVQERRQRRIPGQPFAENFPYTEWLTPDQADVALRSAAEKRTAGVYDPNWGLVILLNPIEFGDHQQVVEDLMAAATAAARNRFASVWVLWKGVGYNTWHNGQAGRGKVVRLRPRFRSHEAGSRLRFG